MSDKKTEGRTLADQVRSGKASRVECESYVSAMERRHRIFINPEHEAADAFWRYWKENGETHKHGYYESTWGAINAALAAAGIRTKP